MKKFRKLKMLLMALMIAAMLPVQVFAANGSIMFSDLTAKSGETIDVKFAVTSSAGAIGDATVTMTYDTQALKFEGAEGVQQGANAGELVFTGKGDGTAAELRTVLKFRVLKEGSLAVNVASYTATSHDGASLELEAGSSAITAEKGDTPVSDNTSADDVQNTGAGGKEAIGISDTYAITLLHELPSVTLPKQYVKTDLLLNGEEYPVWQDQDKSSYYIVYAQNNDGEKQLYQYDSKEGTYQRFIAPKAEEVSADNSIIGKAKEFVQGNLVVVMIAAAAAVVLLLLLVLTLGVKLHNRNREIDELYDSELGGKGKAYDYSDDYEEEFASDEDDEESDDGESYYDEDDEYYDDEDDYDEDEYDEEDYEDDGDERQDRFSMDFIDLE